MTDRVTLLFFEQLDKHKEVFTVCSRSFRLGVKSSNDNVIDQAKKEVETINHYCFTKDEVLNILENLKKDL
jgi:hypothetical protein